MQPGLAGLAVFVLALFSVSVTRLTGDAATIWPANAVIVVCLLNTDLRRWPWLVGAGLAGNLAAYLVVGRGPGVALALCCCNTLEILIVAGGLRRLIGARIDLSRARDLWNFGWLVVVASLISAAGGALVFWIASRAPINESLITWALADVLGLIIVAPALLVLTPTTLARLLRNGAAPKTVVLLGGFAVALVCIFGQS